MHVGIDIDVGIDVDVDVAVDEDIDVEIYVNIDVEVDVDIDVDIDVDVDVDIDVDIDVDMDVDGDVDIDVDIVVDIDVDKDEGARGYGACCRCTLPWQPWSVGASKHLDECATPTIGGSGRPFLDCMALSRGPQDWNLHACLLVYLVLLVETTTPSAISGEWSGLEPGENLEALSHEEP